jgi:hypothetical protein
MYLYLVFFKQIVFVLYQKTDITKMYENSCIWSKNSLIKTQCCILLYLPKVLLKTVQIDQKMCSVFLKSTNCISFRYDTQWFFLKYQKKIQYKSSFTYFIVLYLFHHWYHGLHCIEIKFVSGNNYAKNGVSSYIRSNPLVFMQNK